MKTKKTQKQIPVREHMKIKYVLSADILEIKGKKWFDKYCEASGPGNTGIIVPANDPSHGLKKEQYGIYLHDFERCSNVVDHGVPTYWD